MPALHLLRARVDEIALRVFAERTGTRDDDLCYALHLAMRRRWGAAAPQPFRWPAPGSPGVLLGYSADPAPLLAPPPAAEPPDWTADWQAEDAEADLLRAIFPDGAQARPMPSDWAAGRRFAFNLRLRPVTRYGGAARAERRAGHGQGERDAFLVAVERRADGAPRLDREEVYRDWLAARIAPWGTLDGARLEGGRRIRTVRSSHGKPGARRIEGPEALFDGVLRIDEPEGFAHALTRGIGRHVAFGFGMLLLRPAGR